MCVRTEWVSRIVREQVVVLLTLLRDHLLRDAAEGVEVAFRTRVDESPQELAVRHDPLSCVLK